MIDSNNSPNINVDELMRKIRQEISRHQGRSQISTRKDRSTLEVNNDTNISALTSDISYIESLLLNAESRAYARTKWPNALNRFPFNISLKLQKAALKIVNFLFKDQREINFNLLLALKEFLKLNRQLVQELEALNIQIDKLKNSDKDTENLDDFYVAFENQFRGNREEVKERLSTYIPILERAITNQDDDLILDIGCGRGEWLELLSKKGFRVAGVDSNTVMVQQCRTRGLNATLGDGIQYLRSLPDNSFSVVSSFHVIEHLSMRQLIALVDEALRVLRPGGSIILETPNPENLIVGACNFYLDPTHHNPIPPAAAQFILENRGFSSIEVQRLHRTNEAHKLNDSFLNELLCGAQDYAVIGWKL